MFKEITLKNYRTHKLTTIQLKPVTLFIGNNNSGKTNFLEGIRHFSRLVRQGHPALSCRPQAEQTYPQGMQADDYIPRPVQAYDYFPHRYRLAEDDEPMSISIRWEGPLGEVDYQMELHPHETNKNFIQCQEKITFKRVSDNESKEISSGYDSPNNSLLLRRKVEADSSLQEPEKNVCRMFFRHFASTSSYHFQPICLKGFDAQQPSEVNPLPLTGDESPIAVALGHEGQGLLHMISYIRALEQESYTRFVALMRRFERNFHGIRDDKEHEPPRDIWEFDSGRTDQVIEHFTSDVVSDGLLKVAAIALLAALERPPALILLEEIENGVNPGNIQQLMYWIWQTTAPNQDGWFPQFILTSHSPSVLREFHEHLDHVYTFRLNKPTFKSHVINLNEALDVLVKVGTVDGEIDEDTGLIQMPKYELSDLWYSGTIG